MLEQLIKERDEFLMKHPELQHTQDVLNKELDNSSNRLGTVSWYMSQSLKELSVELTMLALELDKVRKTV